MTKLVLYTGNIMNGGPAVLRRGASTKSNTEFTNSLRANFRTAWESSTQDVNGHEALLGGSSVQERPSDYRSWTTQTGDAIFIPAPSAAAEGLPGDGPQYDITLKLFFLPTTDPNKHTEYVNEAVARIMQELQVSSIDLLIISFPGVTFDADDEVEEPEAEGLADLIEQTESMTRSWTALEKLHADGKVKQLGLAEFGSARLKQFLPRITVRPSLDQINVRDCCVVPRGLIVYAKQEKIELMTHNDSTNILPKGTIREILGDGPNGAGVLCSSPGTELSGEVEPQWVAKYTAVVKDRGVIENKGYLAMANLEH